MRIGVVHATVNAIQPIVNAFTKKEPTVTVLNFVNEGLLDRANRYGQIDSKGIRSFYHTVMLAAENALDGLVIACTLFSDRANQMGQLTGIPTIAIDQAMIEQAVLRGRKIGIMATTSGSAPAAQAKLLNESKRTGRPLSSETVVSTDAMIALKAGNVQEHNAILREAAKRLCRMGCETLLLSQITMAVAAPSLGDLDCEVLTSPETGAEAMLELLRS